MSPCSKQSGSDMPEIESNLSDHVKPDEASDSTEDIGAEFRAATINVGDPKARRNGFAVPSTADEIKEAKIRWGDEAWQMKVLKFINSDKVQKFLVGLLVLDVLILFSELAIDAFFPACNIITRDAISCCPSSYDEAHSEYNDEAHRLLGGGGGDICEYPLQETDYQGGCDGGKHHGVHVAHGALFWTTISILGMFQVELLFLIYLLGPRNFCSELMYIIDLVVISLSLGLEITFRYASQEALGALPGILVIFRLWRFVRIGHGLISSTYEVQEKKIVLAMEYIEELEEKVKKYEKVDPKRPKKLQKLHSQNSQKWRKTSTRSESDQSFLDLTT